MGRHPNDTQADKYAKRTSAIVYLPEFMDGHAMDPSLFASMDILTGDGSIIWKVYVPQVIRFALLLQSFSPLTFSPPAAR
jgi:hypothetical protein